MSHLPSGAISGFFPTEVIGHLRPPGQIIQWNIGAPNPSGLRHVESGAIKRTGHLSNRGGFTAQQESGIEIDFGDTFINDGSGFATDTVNLTFNFGEVNANILSRFDRLFNQGSGEVGTDFTAFNFRYWVGNLSAFNVVSVSGDPPGVTISGVKPSFFFRESAEWRQNFKLELTEISGGVSGAPLIPVSGVLIMPSSMPDCPNVSSREDDISISGAFLDREFTNFVYTRAFFPALPSGQRYKLGTYGALGQGDFTLKFSYDYTALDANIIDPQDLKDFLVFGEPGLPPETASEGISGWWQLNESSPKLSAVSGFDLDDFSFAQITMTLVEKREGGGNIGRASGIVSSGTASGFAMDLRSDRKDQVFTNDQKPRTMMFTGDLGDGNIGFTYTGWIAPNDPSGSDPNVGVGLRPPWPHTGVLCRFNTQNILSFNQYRCYYQRDLQRFLWQIGNKADTLPVLSYNYMNVDSQDNGQGGGGAAGTFADFGTKEGGGGIVKHDWYFITLGYNPEGEGSLGGNVFFRVNDGPIETMPLGSQNKSFQGASADREAPFSIGNGRTRTGGNGQIGPGAGQYDNWILHRGKVLNNREMLAIYNKGFGREFPMNETREIDFSIPFAEDIDPNPVPLRRGLRSWYNFSEPSGTQRLADSQRYWDLTENVAGVIPSGIQSTSGIIVDEFPEFPSIEAASGALQIRKSGGIGFRDGQPGNGRVWTADNTQSSPFGNMDFTLLAWVRFPRAGFLEPIASVWTAPTNDRQWVFSKGSTDLLSFSRANGTGPTTLTIAGEFATDFKIDRYYMVYVQLENIGPSTTGVLTINAIDSVTGKSYKNSVTSTFQWNSLFPDSSIPFAIGGLDVTTGPIVADMDIAAFGSWYRKLSKKEIDLLFNNRNGLNFGASNFTTVDRIYWESKLTRAGDPSTI